MNQQINTFELLLIVRGKKSSILEETKKLLAKRITVKYEKDQDDFGFQSLQGKKKDFNMRPILNI